jgi:proteasome activator subunit 4
MLTMIPVITCFLPSTHTDLYLPALFRIWEAFNSSTMDDRLLDFCGALAEDNVAGKAGEGGEFAAEWKDVGIWTEWQWNLISGKALSSLSKCHCTLGR